MTDPLRLEALRVVVGDKEQAKRWGQLSDQCAERYEAALDAIESGSLGTAEAELARANELESEAGAERSRARELIAESMRTGTVVTTESHDAALEAALAEESANVHRSRVSGELEFYGAQKNGLGYARLPMWRVRLVYAGPSR